MTLDHFARLLRDTMGLDIASVGTTSLERALKERQRLRGITDLARYWNSVTASQTELQSLIEAIVVPETWFFRDPQAFAALSGSVLQEWQRTHPDGVFRVLSLPCATGEEPYTMAMALLDAGLLPARFRIDAVDISERSLAHARDGMYGRGSFRGQDLEFRDRHFERTPGGHRINDSVRAQVSFQQGNLFSPTFLPGVEIYDVVFCRNVLIYFDRDTQSKAIAVLSRLLTPDGTVFVGSSEPGVFLSHDFVSAKLPMAFAFRRAAASAEQTLEAALSAPHAVFRPASPAPVFVARPRSPRRPAPVSASASASASTQAHTKPQSASDPGRPIRGLEDARRLADEGRFIEAARCCNDALQRQGPSAEAFYLLGLVRDASGNQAEAVSFYQKALYLDPHHAEALVHLALLMEGRGELANARALRSRIKRLGQEGHA